MPRFSSTTVPLVIQANAYRQGCDVTNEGAGTLYIKKGTTTPSAVNYSARILAGVSYELPMPYYGPLSFIFVGAGDAMISEFTINNEIQ